MLDRYDLYELCVTEPARLARFLLAVHGGSSPCVLREDFSGTGALASYWAASDAARRAIAVDRDAEPLARAKGPRLRAVCAEVMASKVRADIIAAVNFPLGYWHTREALVRYLRHARACLNPGGVFVADMYGGARAMERMRVTTKLRGPSGERVEYTWEQREADALTSMITDVLHFRVTPARRGAKSSARRLAERAVEWPEAFVYRWRLWGVAELREAYAEAGFATVEVYDRMGDAIDERGRLHVRPVAPGEGLDEDYVVYVVGRRGPVAGGRRRRGLS